MDVVVVVLRTIIDFNKAGNDGVTVTSAGPVAYHLISLQTDNCTSTSPLNFLQVYVLPDANESTEGTDCSKLLTLCLKKMPKLYKKA